MKRLVTSIILAACVATGATADPIRDARRQCFEQPVRGLLLAAHGLSADELDSNQRTVIDDATAGIIAQFMLNYDNVGQFAPMVNLAAFTSAVTELVESGDISVVMGQFLTQQFLGCLRS